MSASENSQEPSFKKHVKGIELAKQATGLLEQMTLAEKSMGIVWEHLFDHLCLSQAEEPDWKTIKELSSIVGKLLQNYQHLQQFSTQLNAQNPTLPLELSEATLESIEAQLKLL